MKKIVILLLLFLTSLLFAQEAYYIGDGRSDLSVEVGEPELSNIGTDASWIPGFVINTINDDIAKYSAIKIVDTYNQKKIIAALKKNEGALYSEEDAIKLGNFEVAKQMIIVNIIGKNSSYSVSVKINDKERNTVLASYNANCLYAELESGSVLKQATLDLLTQLKVNLTESAKKELTQVVASNTTIEAQKLQAKAVTALEEGSNIQALSYLFDARAKDDNLASVNNAISKISTSIAGGTLSAKVQTLVQNRKEFAALFDKIEAFYDENPPYVLVIEPHMDSVKIDYEKEKILIPFIHKLSVRPSDYYLFEDLNQAYKAQEDSANWGLDIPTLPDIIYYEITVSIKNGNKKKIGTTTIREYSNIGSGCYTNQIEISATDDISNLELTVDDISLNKDHIFKSTKIECVNLKTYNSKYLVPSIEFVSFEGCQFKFVSSRSSPFLYEGNYNSANLKEKLTELFPSVSFCFDFPENSFHRTWKNISGIYPVFIKPDESEYEDEAEKIKNKELFSKDFIHIGKFYLYKYSITQGMYLAVMGNIPSLKNSDNKYLEIEKGARIPISNYDIDAKEFCNKLSILHGLKPAYDKDGYLRLFSNGYQLLQNENETLSDILPKADAWPPLFYAELEPTNKELGLYGSYGRTLRIIRPKM